MTFERQARGAAGEDSASAYLEQRGWRIVERNCRLGRGELDIVALEGRALVFIEVKTRVLGSRSAFSPFDAVGRQKQAQVRGLAARWLQERGDELLTRPPAEIRFDVLGVASTDGGTRIEHIRDAF